MYKRIKIIAVQERMVQRSVVPRARQEESGQRVLLLGMC